MAAASCCGSRLERTTRYIQVAGDCRSGRNIAGCWTLGETRIFSVFHQTHHLHARSIPQFEMAADGVRYGAQDLACELPIHDRYARSIFVVMPCEGSARQ